MWSLRRRPDTTSVSLRWRVMTLAVSMVTMVVALMAVAIYLVISRALYADVDTQLEDRAELLIAGGALSADPAMAIEGTAYSDVTAMLVLPGGRPVYPVGVTTSQVPIGEPEKDVIRGDLLLSKRTVDGQRVLAVHQRDGSSLLLAKSLAPTDAVMARLRWVLLAIGGGSVAVAAVAGAMVSSAGLRPVGRLTEAAERVARTDDLKPIPVYGTDELSRLTESFNLMLGGLAESRDRQARLVADAGHELRTPLTSLRTNVELLMASTQSGAPSLPEDELADLRADVIAQIEELSTLVGDLVDLSRDDVREAANEPVDLSEVVDRSLERVRRRRNDVTFDVETVGWQIDGDAAGLSRAVLNLLDNAAKWSPPGGRVSVRLTQVDASDAELVVSDQGPGVPVHERELVFERFFRSATARAMPGSGLGLAIVKHIAVKHGGTLRIEDADPGGHPPGTSVCLRLPGRPTPTQPIADASTDDVCPAKMAANPDSEEDPAT